MKFEKLTREQQMTLSPAQAEAELGKIIWAQVAAFLRKKHPTRNLTEDLISEVTTVIFRNEALRTSLTKNIIEGNAGQTARYVQRICRTYSHRLIMADNQRKYMETTFAKQEEAPSYLGGLTPHTFYAVLQKRPLTQEEWKAVKRQASKEQLLSVEKAQRGEKLSKADYFKLLSLEKKYMAFEAGKDLH